MVRYRRAVTHVYNLFHWMICRYIKQVVEQMEHTQSHFLQQLALYCTICQFVDTHISYFVCSLYPCFVQDFACSMSRQTYQVKCHVSSQGEVFSQAIIHWIQDPSSLVINNDASNGTPYSTLSLRQLHPSWCHQRDYHAETLPLACNVEYYIHLFLG